MYNKEDIIIVDIIVNSDGEYVGVDALGNHYDLVVADNGRFIVEVSLPIEQDDNELDFDILDTSQLDND
jgi:hypothetical protein